MTAKKNALVDAALGQVQGGMVMGVGGAALSSPALAPFSGGALGGLTALSSGMPAMGTIQAGGFAVGEIAKLAKKVK